MLLVHTIVENTNTVIETFLAGKQDMIDDSDKYSFYKKVDLIDIKAFLGLLYLRARLKLNMFDRGTLWHHETANNFFEAMISLNCFIFILRFITFDEKSTRAERRRYNKFVCVWSFFESFNKNISKFCYPSSCLAVDKTLYPYCGRIGLKQYNPSKPAKLSCYSTLHLLFLALRWYAGSSQ